MKALPSRKLFRDNMEIEWECVEGKYRAKLSDHEFTFIVESRERKWSWLYINTDVEKEEWHVPRKDMVSGFSSAEVAMQALADYYKYYITRDFTHEEGYQYYKQSIFGDKDVPPELEKGLRKFSSP